MQPARLEGKTETDERAWVSRPPLAEGPAALERMPPKHFCGLSEVARREDGWRGGGGGEEGVLEPGLREHLSLGVGRVAGFAKHSMPKDIALLTEDGVPN